MGKGRRERKKAMSPEERQQSADALRAWMRRQRGRLAEKFKRSEERVRAARVEAMEDWQPTSLLRAGSKKPSLEYYDKRGW